MPWKQTKQSNSVKVYIKLIPPPPKIRKLSILFRWVGSLLRAWGIPAIASPAFRRLRWRPLPAFLM
jgi:hypothetical protein